MKRAILTFNAGSSSIKAGVHLLDDGVLDHAPALRAQASGIGGDGVFETRFGDAPTTKIPVGEDDPNGYDGAWARIFEAVDKALQDNGMSEADVAGVGHRVVHGGVSFSHPVAIDDGVVEALAALSPLAPGHQPHNLNGVAHARRYWPGTLQVACFDTAFHRTQPAVAQRFALPRDYEDAGVIRYGFHGLSYDYMSHAMPDVIGPAAQGRVVVAHLGSGASMCAIRGGESVASTMGFTALDGLPMGTRCGDIDPGVILYMMHDRNLSFEEMSNVLYKESGLLGISGLTGDMRALLESKDPRAGDAVDYFVYRCVREIGALAAVMEGIDALVFTAGIGENAAEVRARILDRLGWLGLACDEDANAAHGPQISPEGATPSAWVIPTDEAFMIARSVVDVLAAS